MNLIYAFSGGPLGIIIIILTYISVIPPADVVESFPDDFMENVNTDTTPNDPITGLSTVSSGGKFKEPSDGAIAATIDNTLSHDFDTSDSSSNSGSNSGSSSGFGFETGSGSSSGSSSSSNSGSNSGSSSGFGFETGSSSSSGSSSGSSSSSDEITQKKSKSLEDTTTSTKLVGGELLPMDTTVLLVAGVKTNAIWLIPIVLSIVGIGLFVVSRKSVNS